MKKWILDLLICPNCEDDAEFDIIISENIEDEIISGSLMCSACSQKYQIINGIPRFVEQTENYAENFGQQWHQFRTTQIDRFGGHTLSGSRLLNDTGWTSESLRGKLVLDAGCGAGRFADELAQHGATVIACDLSSAVDACKQTLDDPIGYSTQRGEVTVIQANLLALPFRSGIFDAIHCAGVIQHTPDPSKVMSSLPIHLKSGGRLFYNFYEIDPTSKFQVIKYLLRRTTPNWQMRNLLTFCRWLCWLFFVPSWIMSHLPVVRFFNRFLPICSVHPHGVPLRQQFDMTLLDTVDWYGPRFEIRQNHSNVAALLSDLNLSQIETSPGLARAVKP